MSQNSLGRWVAAFGFLLLLIAIATSGYRLWNGRASSPCSTSPIPLAAQNAGIYVNAKQIALNDRLCIAINGALVFAAERAALLKARADVDSAQKAKASAATPDAKTQADKSIAANRAILDALPTQKMIYLFADNFRLPVAPLPVSIEPDGWTSATFFLRPDPDAKTDASTDWRAVLMGGTNSGVRKVRLGIGTGISDTKPVLPWRPFAQNDVPMNVDFQIFDPLLVGLGCIGILLIATGIVGANWTGGMLRDRIPDPTNGDPNPPFSLGRTQMGFWLLLTVGTFLYLWLVSGQFIHVITIDVLALLGISAVSGLSARAIDVQTTTAAKAAAAAGGPPIPTPAQSQGFWNDILSDGNGIVLHRIQLVAWSLILGAIFVWSAIWSFAYPPSDGLLLLLAGVVNGTYLGFKVTE